MTAVELAVVTDALGRCDLVLHDSAGLAARLEAGTPFTALIHRDSGAKSRRFLETIRDEGAAFDWELLVEHDAGTMPLHFAGYRRTERLLIVAGSSRGALVELGRRFGDTQATGEAFGDIVGVTVGGERARTADEVPYGTYEELTRVNNELINAHREFARKNADLERIVTALESADRQKNVLLAQIAHDLRGPLSPIVTWTTLLREGNLSAHQVSRALDALQRSTRALVVLIEDLLDFARVTTGKLRVALQPIDLRTALRAGVDQVQALAAAHEVTIDVHLPDGPLSVSGDSDRLARVFWNLLSNAVKASPLHARVELAAAIRGDAIEIRVVDHGRGIAPAQLPHLFEPFHQAADAPADGLGLGLPITRDLVTQHGGSITAASAGAGQGATFTVTLPLLAREALTG